MGEGTWALVLDATVIGYGDGGGPQWRRSGRTACTMHQMNSEDECWLGQLVVALGTKKFGMQAQDPGWLIHGFTHLEGLVA